MDRVPGEVEQVCWPDLVEQARDLIAVEQVDAVPGRRACRASRSRGPRGRRSRAPPGPAGCAGRRSPIAPVTRTRFVIRTASDDAPRRG